MGTSESTVIDKIKYNLKYLKIVYTKFLDASEWIKNINMKKDDPIKIKDN